MVDLVYLSVLDLGSWYFPGCSESINWTCSTRNEMLVALGVEELLAKFKKKLLTTIAEHDKVQVDQGGVVMLVPVTHQ